MPDATRMEKLASRGGKRGHQQVFEEESADFAKALKRALDNRIYRDKKRTRRVVGFPQFHARAASKPTFRPRKVDHKRFAILDNKITLPKIGPVRVRESPRPLKRLLKTGPDDFNGRITFVTASERDGYWRLSLNVRLTKELTCSRFLDPSPT